MENTGFKGLLLTLWQRVVVSYKTTLIGIAVAAVPYVLAYFTGSPNKVLQTIGLVLGSVFALVKEKVPAPPPLPAP